MSLLFQILKVLTCFFSSTWTLFFKWFSISKP